MEIIKDGKVTLYPVCSFYKNIEKIHLIYEMVNYFFEEDPVKNNREFGRVKIVLPYFKEENVHNGMVYAPYPINEHIKCLLSDYEIK